MTFLGSPVSGFLMMSPIVLVKHFLRIVCECAKCHDHKFDPVPTRDYYSIQAVFDTTQLVERKADFLPRENQGGFDEERFLRKMEKGFLELQEEMDEIVQQNALKWFASQLEEADSDQKQEVLDTQSKWKQAVSRVQVPPPVVHFKSAVAAYAARGLR